MNINVLMKGGESNVEMFNTVMKLWLKSKPSEIMLFY
jgi:hypothetical protein